MIDQIQPAILQRADVGHCYPISTRDGPRFDGDDKDILDSRLGLAIDDRDWSQAEKLIEKLKSREDETGEFAYGNAEVPIDCLSVLLARFRGEKAIEESRANQIRDLLNQKIQRSPRKAGLLSELAVFDALINDKAAAISEAKRAVEMLPISTDAVDGWGLVVNLAVVYAWTNEPDPAFETLNSLNKPPSRLFYGDLKLDPMWDPIRKDPRFDKLLAELAPRD